jgi:hypothetical protein
MNTLAVIVTAVVAGIVGPVAVALWLDQRRRNQAPIFDPTRGWYEEN